MSEPRTWNNREILGKMEWEGMPDAIEWISTSEVEDPNLAVLWETMESAYLDYERAYREVSRYLDDWEERAFANNGDEDVDD